MAYTTSAEKRRQIKEAVLHEIAPGVSCHVCGRRRGATYLFGSIRVHARFCAQGIGHYKFNINPSTLNADYELWICGKTDHWYLIPVHVIQEMYDHPDAYPDRRHPEIRVVTVDATAHSVAYAAPSVKRSLHQYYQAKLGMA